MLNNKVRTAVKPRSGIILPNHLRVRFHESSGAAVAYTGKLNGVDFSGSLTFNAAPTWGEGAALAPTSNTTVRAIATQSAHPELFAVLTPPQGGGLIFLWSYYMTAYTNNGGNPSILLGWGRVSSGGDGYSIGTSQGANHNVLVYFRGIGEGAFTQASKADNTLSVQKTVQQYLKCTPGALAAYTAIDGNWSSASSATSIGTLGTGGFTAASFFSNVASNTAAGTEYWNLGATDNKRVSDLLVIRDEDGSLFSQMATIAAEHAANRRELLWALDTL